MDAAHGGLPHAPRRNVIGGPQVLYGLILARDRTDGHSALMAVSTSKVNRVEYITLPCVTEIESSGVFDKFML